MHELSICQALLEQLTTLSQQHPGGRIVGIHLHNGPLSGVESALLQHAFEIYKKGTLADQAVLTIENQPLRIHCRDCLGDSEASINDWTCPECASLATEVIGGDALILARLQLDIH
ncbi:MAG TPA: hydrogenase maturation nickel metallochaperone HypA [Magnetococcales bacterium]|nr:hydrogenase maturation nickel metallochaperone HypA [Magnetococcales bacterium]